MVERETEGRLVEAPVVVDRAGAGGDQRVLSSRVDLDVQDAFEGGRGLDGGAVDLREAAVAEGVLHPGRGHRPLVAE